MSPTEFGHSLPIVSVLPFALLLLSIAVFPLWKPQIWKKNTNKSVVVFLLSVPIVTYFLFGVGETGAAELGHKVKEYVSFLALLGSLFVISSGIYLRGTLPSSALMNSGVLGLGAVLANIIGTTGASVLLIRPLLRANSHRPNQIHTVVFFIFVVSNCGGLLTPLGDPPLFLGFLTGVPFLWTLQLWKPWVFVNGLLLIIYFVLDSKFEKRESKLNAQGQQNSGQLELDGKRNLFFLAGIILVVWGAGRGAFNGGKPWANGIQEILMSLFALVSYFTTPPLNRTSNGFSFGPINEVAILFAGIFVTMTPVLLILNARGGEIGLTLPHHFFWATGTLSSFLDNAPTYLAFSATAAGMKGVALQGKYLETFLALGHESHSLLTAISCGAVMMGANTYIGNGPNFMVKAIAEESGVKMPSFFGYMVYSLCILIPIFGLVTLVFF